jgi:hypothetical protein
MARRSARRAFTLLEIATVLAVVMVLAAIAIPKFVAAQNRSKKAEVGLVLNGLNDALVGWLNATDDDTIFATPRHPRDIFALDKNLIAWDPPPAELSRMGFRPDGDVRGAYAISRDSGAPFHYFIEGHSDVDNDDDVYSTDVEIDDETLQKVASQEICGVSTGQECF